MILASLYLVFSYLGFCGLGIFFSAFILKKQNLSRNQSFLFGIFISVLIIQVYHLFFKISLSLTLVFFILGFIFFLKDFFKNKNYYKNLIPILLVTATLVSIFIVGEVKNYDSGLYHLGNILWNFEGPIVKGLTNLHWPFGNSHTLFLFDSFFFPFRGYPEGFKLSNGLFFLAWFNFFLEDLSQGENQRKKASHFFILLSFLPILYFLYKQAHSPGTDWPINIFVFLTFYLLMKFFEQKEEPSSFSILGTTFLISCMAISFKFSFIPIFGVISILLITKFKKYPTLKPYLYLGITYLFLWGVRNILISGCLIYPAKQSCFPNIFYWGTPVPIIESAVNTVISWSRIWKSDPNIVLAMPFWKWFPIWFKNFFHNYWILISFNFLIFVFYVRSNVKNKTFNTPANFLLLINLFCLIYWFLVAPDPRYGQAYFISLVIIELAYLFELNFFPKLFKINKKYTLVALSLMLIFVIFKRRDTISLLSLGTIPKDITAVWQIKDGIKFYTTTGGKDQCWAEKVPCSPQQNPNLKMEIKDGIIKAFYIQ